MALHTYYQDIKLKIIWELGSFIISAMTYYFLNQDEGNIQYNPSYVTGTHQSDQCGACLQYWANRKVLDSSSNPSDNLRLVKILYTPDKSKICTVIRPENATNILILATKISTGYTARFSAISTYSFLINIFTYITRITSTFATLSLNQLLAEYSFPRSDQPLTCFRARPVTFFADQLRLLCLLSP